MGHGGGIINKKIIFLVLTFTSLALLFHIRPVVDQPGDVLAPSVEVVP
jgi:hypothetical protein